MNRDIDIIFSKKLIRRFDKLFNFGTLLNISLNFSLSLCFQQWTRTAHSNLKYPPIHWLLHQQFSSVLRYPPVGVFPLCISSSFYPRNRLISFFQVFSSSKRILRGLCGSCFRARCAVSMSPGSMQLWARMDRGRGE